MRLFLRTRIRKTFLRNTRVVSFGHGQNLNLGRGLLGNGICGGGSTRSRTPAASAVPRSSPRSPAWTSHRSAPAAARSGAPNGKAADDLGVETGEAGPDCCQTIKARRANRGRNEAPGISASLIVGEHDQDIRSRRVHSRGGVEQPEQAGQIAFFTGRRTPLRKGHLSREFGVPNHLGRGVP